MAKEKKRASRFASVRQARRRLTQRPAGLAPGTLIAASDAGQVEVHAILFGPDVYDELGPLAIDELPSLLGRSPVVWINVTGLGDVDKLRQLGTLFDLHPLALEDVVNVGQRPKVESYGDDLLIFVRMTEETARLDVPLIGEQLCLQLRPGLVVTFQERPGDCFDPVRKRLRAGNPRIRSIGADYLAYALLDAVTDRYVLLLAGYEELLENIEEKLLASPSDTELEHIHRIRRDLVALRRAAVPLREVLATLLRDSLDGTWFGEETRIFLRDCHDHSESAVEQIDAGRELANSLMEVYLSTASHRTNEAMKTLTIIATLFIPLSFIAGLYGMNFDTVSPWNMPELGWAYGYPGVLLLMTIVVVGLLMYLKRKGWF